MQTVDAASCSTVLFDVCRLCGFYYMRGSSHIATDKFKNVKNIMST